jgi:ribose 5-phosphate isomerase B
MNQTSSQTNSNLEIYLGADHGGYQLKEAIKKWLIQQNFVVKDLGAYQLDPQDDYPQYAAAVARSVQNNPQAVGILFCRSGGGMVIAANKFANIRAVEVFNQMSAQHARQHNNANIISLAADWISQEEAQAAIQAFLHTSFFQEERHQRRIEQIRQLEAQN